MAETQRYRLLMASILILSLSFLCTVNGFDLSRSGQGPSLSSTSLIGRRSMISTFGSIASGTMLIASTPNAALAASDANTNKPSVIDYTIDDFTVSIPSGWKVISKPNSNSNNDKKGQNSKIFSAIDFQSGSVITVVREQACSVQEYAQSANICNIVLPSDKRLFSEDTIAKDISKLLIRHDDRDNVVLEGITRLNSYDLNQNVLDLSATTTIPDGGTYRDTMGIDRPSTIDRKVKARALVTVQSKDVNGEQTPGVESTSVLTLWLNAPLDEWQKPVMGTKLNQVWDSIKLNR